jgi:hypothetical protein
LKCLLDIDPHVKAIVAGGYANDPVMADYRQYGFMGVVKPFKMVELTEVFHQVLNPQPLDASPVHLSIVMERPQSSIDRRGIFPRTLEFSS